MAEFILEDPAWGTAMILAVIVIAILAIVAVMAVQRPVFFKMSLRNAFRRRSQTMVVVLGLMVGTAILSASLVAEDSMEYWIVEDVYKEQYMVDEWVGAESGGTFDYSVYEYLADDPDVAAITDGMSPVMFLSGTSINNLDEGQTETGVNVQGVDIDLDRSLGDFETLDGGKITSASLGPFEAMVTESLAKTARMHEGDSVMVYYVPPSPVNATGDDATGATDAGDGINFMVLTVKHIVEDTGKANHNKGRTMWVTLGTAQEMAGAPGAINAVRVSNNGDVVGGVEHSERAVEALEAALEDAAPGVGLTPDQFTVTP